MPRKGARGGFSMQERRGSGRSEATRARIYGAGKQTEAAFSLGRFFKRFLSRALLSYRKVERRVSYLQGADR